MGEVKITFRESRPEQPKRGDAWYDDNPYAEGVAPQHIGKRPIRVQVADNASFMVYSQAYTQEQGWHGGGWTVSGEPDNLTLTPSVNMAGLWHGYITNGELTP